MDTGQIFVTITADADATAADTAWDHVPCSLTLVDGGGWMIVGNDGDTWDTSQSRTPTTIESALAEARHQAGTATIES